MSSDSQLRPGESRAGDPRSGEPRAAASRPEPSPTPFERLVRILRAGGGSADGPDLGALAELGAPSTLDRLLRAALVAAVRRGPSSEREGWGPARLLDAAERGAGAGAVPASTAPRLRATLAELEAELHDRCLWDPSTSLWWHPLPPPGPMEAIWRTLEERFSEDAPGADPERLAGLGGALPGRAGAGSPGWLVLPSALPEAVARRVHRELVAAEEAGVLALARGGVGAGDRASEVRTDRVTYRSGLEPELLQEAPAVAVLVQWLLGRLPERVGAFSPSGSGSALHAPATAMLARYRAPCRGFAPHVDNPGGRVDGAEDNGRALSLVLYLNEPDAPCAGGEIA
ncbi:MAG: 2OG-Fe(II) oxygenase, partial [Acidobacteriota bacterium]